MHKYNIYQALCNALYNKLTLPLPHLVPQVNTPFATHLAPQVNTPFATPGTTS
jgi:hypothetical protein